jgi:glyoxylase-like metal-dependent hydrolase (beta-lactamase superfamily II)
VSIDNFWLFHCGYARVPRRLIEAGASTEAIHLPFLAGLFVHSEHGPILIDAPFGHEGPTHAGVLGSMMRSSGAVTFKLDWSIVPRIEQIGFRAAEVDHVLITHMHWDHTGGLKEVAHARFHVSKDEWQHAMSLSVLDALRSGYARGDYRSAGSHVATFEPRRDDPYDLPEVDLFGDGTVRAISLPGHSAGHCGFLLSLGGGREVFFLGDAVFSIRQVTHGTELGSFPRFACHDLETTNATIARLRLFAEEHPDALLISSHDPEWAERVLRGPVSL